MGGKVLLDVHILVDPRCSVSEGHHTGEQVEIKLLEELDNVTDVTVHVDPEDDEIMMPSKNLPARKVLQSELKNRWQHIAAANEIQHIDLHYLAGKLYIEIKLPITILDDPTQADTLETEFTIAIQDLSDIESLKLFFTSDK